MEPQELVEPQELSQELAEPQELAPQEPSPFDTSAETKELETLQNELAQSEAALEANFAKYASELITPELEDLFYEDKEQFFIKIAQMQNQFYQDNIASKQARAQELQGSINQKSLMGQIDQARAKFEQEASVDLNTLLQFYEDYIPNAAKAQLDQLQPYDFFKQLEQIYLSQNANPQGSQGGEKPPSRIAGNATPSANLDYNADLLPTERY